MMFAKLRAALGLEKRKPKKRTSRPSREAKTKDGGAANKQSTASSRDVAILSPRLASFEEFRYMLKDLSKRLESIRENPEETYLINTEVNVRVLGVLENLSALTERNTVALESLAGRSPVKQHEEGTSDKKRRAREVLAALESCGPLTYEELRKELKPEVTYNRVTALVSEMIRDGVPLQREGRPVRVGLGESLTESN
jgi:hypothetical protein